MTKQPIKLGREFTYRQLSFTSAITIQCSSAKKLLPLLKYKHLSYCNNCSEKIQMKHNETA